jgi:hypothetical protein
MPGFATSAPEVTNVSRHGFWLLLGDEELLVRLEWPSADHLYWPQLDVDLSVRSIRAAADFPLVSRASEEPSTSA